MEEYELTITNGVRSAFCSLLSRLQARNRTNDIESGKMREEDKDNSFIRSDRKRFMSHLNLLSYVRFAGSPLFMLG